MSNFSRRSFLGAGALAAILPNYFRLAAAESKQRKIRDLQVMMLQGPRTYTLVKVTADDGAYGVAEAYGSPNVAVKEQILSMGPWLIGKDPLEIDLIYTFLETQGRTLSGSRTDGSAHNLVAAASGIEMALWDLAGKVLGVPTSTLLGGRFRKKVRVYHDVGPRNMLDKAACREWAAQMKADPSGFTAHKIGPPRNSPGSDEGRDPANRELTVRELLKIREGFENIREALGWEHDIMVHCHWEYDLRTALQLAEAVESIKPLWLEDPMPVDYSDAWPKLCEASHVPILTGENLSRRQGFKDFLTNHGCDIANPDLRHSGGFLETKRIADMADVFDIPMTNHNTGSQLHTWATCQWASSIRDYMICETVTGRGDWMDKLLLLDGPYIKDGFVQVTEKTGLGVELNPDVVKAHLTPGETWWG